MLDNVCSIDSVCVGVLACLCCVDASHAATLAELERVREELVEDRALRHLEAAGTRGESDSDSAPESDPVVDALQLSEESVSTHTHTHTHTTHTHCCFAVQYFNLVASVCEGGMVRDRPTERKMPVVPDPAERLSVIEERQKVNSATSTLKNCMYLSLAHSQNCILLLAHPQNCH